ncbi:MAG: type II toxin-antitoxin system YhaV family toxin [Gemmatimonadota bacterium]
MKRSRRSKDSSERPATPLVVNGWRLLVWSEFEQRWRALKTEVERLRERDPGGYRTTSAAKLLRAVSDAALRDIPADPAAARYRQGKTVGQEYSHWRRAKFFNRFRLFYRYSTRHRMIVYVWLNDENTLRKRGARTDPYFVFRRMLEAGAPPDDWDALVAACRSWVHSDIDEQNT